MSADLLGLDLLDLLDDRIRLARDRWRGFVTGRTVTPAGISVSVRRPDQAVAEPIPIPWVATDWPPRVGDDVLIDGGLGVAVVRAAGAAGRPSVRVYRDGSAPGVTVASGVLVAVLFTAEDHDTDAMFDATVSQANVTIPFSGRWRFEAGVHWPGVVAQRFIAIYRYTAGLALIGGYGLQNCDGNEPVVVTSSGAFRANAGEIIQAATYQASGANQTYSGLAQYVFLTGEWVGP